MLPRLIEFLFLVLILYLFYRRIAAPFTRGYDARERERRQEQRVKTADQKQPSRIDRTQVEDAEFKDLD
jgi:hypothetical protein